MSFASEYSELRKKRKKSSEELAQDAIQKNMNYSSLDIAPVLGGTPIKDSAKKDSAKEDTWFQAGAFEDGYQFGDILKSVGSTAADAGLGIVKGGLKLVEGVGDLLLYGAGEVAGLFSDEAEDLLKEAGKSGTVDKIFNPLDNAVDKNSFFGNRMEAVEEGIGQVAGIILTGGLAAGAGLSATAATTGTMFASSFGSGIGEALNSNASDDEAWAYGAMSGAVDAVSEMIFGGLGKGVNALGFSRGISSADDMLAKALTSKLKSGFAKNLLQYGVKAGAEGAEEVIAGIGSALAKKMTYMSEEDLKQLVKDEQLLDQFVVGAITSGIAQSGYVPGMKKGSVREANKTGRDFITGYTQNEQKVIDKEVENRINEAKEKGEKIDKKVESRIREAVEEDLKNGEISIDTIEELLGSDLDSYKAYKDAIDGDKATIEELKEMYGESAVDAEFASRVAEAEQNGEKLTSKQKESLRAQIAAEKQQQFATEVKGILENSKRGEARKALSEDMRKLLVREVTGKDGKTKRTQSDSYLLESYAEVARRGQKFEADVTQYKNENARKTIQNILDAGVANNTRRMHQLASTLAKISDDKGVIFDATDAKRLAQTSFGVNGKTVNGFITADGITINMDSPKYLNSIVGHEISHVLEKNADLYKLLQDAAFEFAKGRKSSNGKFENEYMERLFNARQLYKDVDGYKGAEGHNAIKKEVVADLVGDYLFTDAKFIQNLSVKNRNLFQKIFDEIKYLCKIATAGSEEKRKLEKVKKMFEDAYRSSTTNVKADTKTEGEDLARKNEIGTAKFSLSLDKYSQKQYNSFGWARDTDAITKNELDDMHSKLHTKRSLKDFPQTSYGEAIIEVNDDPYNLGANNVIVFAKGTKNNPEITRIVRVDAFDEDTIDIFREVIYENTSSRAIETLARRTGEGLLRYYDRSNYADYRAYTERARARRSGSEIERNTPVNRNGNQRSGTSEKTQQNDINKTSSNDGVFFDGQKRKYSLSPEQQKADTDYLDAVNRGATETAQKMVDEAAKAAGYNYRGVHRAKTDFTVFDRKKIGTGAGLQFGDGFYVSLDIKDKATADYADSAYGKVKMDLYVKMQSPLELGKPISEETVAKMAKELVWFGDDESVKYGVMPETIRNQLTSGDSYEQMEAIRWLAKENGKEISGLLKEYGFDGIISENEYVTQAVVWDENQLKSSDAVTRDDNGNVIPLSQRFNAENNDIRYSLSDSDGKKLTKAQSDFFKDSKMRDENGALKVMYHGSRDAGFHVFDPAHSDDGTSLFFVDRNDVAASYSGTSETYEAQSIRTAEDMNNFLAKIGYDDYKAVEKDGKFELLENNEHVAWSDTAKGIYEEFCWYEGVGDGDVNYKVYLNLKNPLVVDVEGRNWNNISREFSQELYDSYKTLTDAEKDALVNLASWEEISIFRDEIRQALADTETGVSGTYDKEFAWNVRHAYEKLGGNKVNMYDLFTIASDNFSEESVKEFAVKQMNTRDYAQKAKAEGYDGVIFNNIVDIGGYGGDYTPSTVAIAFDSNQIKSVANENPTGDPDIRYSLSDIDGKPIDGDRLSVDESDTRYSLSHSEDISKGQMSYIETHNNVALSRGELEEAQRVTKAMVDVMMKYSSILPEDKIGKVLTKNGSYDRSVENTTICVRTLAYNEFVDKVQEEIGRPLTQMESFLVSQKLYDIATDPQCLYCYVSLDRKAFNDMLLRYMQDRDTVIAKYNNSDKTPGAISKLYEEFLNGRKDTKNMKDRFNKWLSYVDDGTQLLSLADIATEDSQSTIKANGGVLADQLKDARAYAQSASWSKIQKNYVAYRDEILKLGDRVVKNLNEHYGLRWYSFSDYSAAFIVENMQQITDASIRGLKGLSYTKDTDFAEIFAPSGMNINISVFVNQDANGNFFIDEKQSANFEKALELRERYPNVGIVATVTNDEALRWAGSQEWSDVIIPFHIVRTGADVAEYYKWLNYTAESADTVKDSDLWNAYLDSLNLSESARKKASKNIYPSEHKNDKNTYLNLCDSRGLNPRFVRFAGEDWYMKLVNETRLSADNSSVLKPNYNLEAAKASFQKFVEKGGYEGGWYKKAINVDAEAKAVAKDVLEGKKANEVSYGRQDGFVPEELIAGRKINRQHGKYSLSAEGERQKRYGDFFVRSEDVKYVPDIAPVKDEKADLEARLEVVGEELDALEKAEASEQSERLNSLTDADVPPEIEAPYYGESEAVTVDNPFEERDIKEVGNRKVKAYMYENPEVKPFFQNEANVMLGELRDTIKGEKWYNDEVYYATNGESGWGGTSRHTTQDIAYLLDELGYTYAEIEKGLNAIIEDDGKENNACSKRIEFLLNDRLMNGYHDITGYDIPANQDYINLLNEKQIIEYNEEARKKFFEVADEYAPAEDDIAPVAPRPDPKKLPTSEWKDTASAKIEEFAKSQKANMDADFAPIDEKIAEVLTEEPEDTRKKPGVVSKLRTHVLDKYSSIEDLALKTKNRELMGKANFMISSERRAQIFIGKGKDGVRSLTDLRAEVENAGLEKDFSDYMYHKHNVDRMSLESKAQATLAKLQSKFGHLKIEQVYAIANTEISDTTTERTAQTIREAKDYLNALEAKNKPVFGDSVTAEVSQQRVAEFEKAHPEFKRWAKDIYGINEHLRQMLVDAGVISQETAKLWSEMYPNYVPIRREGKDGAAINVPLDTGRTGVNAPIKRATGGNSDILPLFNTLATRVEQTFRAVAKNNFGIELKNTLGTTIESKKTNIEEVIDSFDNHDELLQKGENGGNPTFTVFENGERVTFEITEELYDALKPNMFTGEVKALSFASKLQRGLLTEYNPVFLATNAIKDAQDVLMNSQHARKTYANMPVAIKEMVTKGKWYKEYMENGGSDLTYFDGKEKTFTKDDTGIKKIIGLPLRGISAANNFIERLPRLAEYIASRKNGASVEVAMLDAARVTTNFAAGGDFTKMLNRNGFTFLNASVQGFNQQVRNIREAKANGVKGVLTLAAKFAAAGLPAMLLNHLLWDDDEEYEDLSDYVKDNYYVIAKTGDGKFIRIPKGRALAVIQNGFTQMENLVTGDDEVDLARFGQLLVENLAPNNPLDNNVIAPIMQAATNRTWYGEDLVPTRLQDLPAEEQFDETTDSLSKWLGETTGLSPYKINYVLNQYSGGVGDVFLPMMTPKAESGDDSFAGNLLAPWKDKFTTDSVLKNQNVSDFYDTIDELAKNANSMYATDEDTLKYKYMNSVNAELGELYQQKREIQNSDLSDEEKYVAVRNIQKQIDEIAKNSLNTYNSVSIDGGYATVGDRHYRWYEPGEDSEAEAGWQKISDKQLEKMENVTGGLGISASDYWKNKEEYDYAYDYPEKYAVAKSVGGYTAFRQYSSELYDIKADKDEDGKSISGSRKEKVIDYVNNLDADYGTKIILFKSEYNADDTYNYDIIEYLNGREDISYSEMVTILKELGFTVHSNGRVTW